MMEKIAVIGVPSSAGARRTGQERGPESIRKAGLLPLLQSVCAEVVDFGDLASVRFSPDSDHPDRQNLFLVAGVIRQLADRVSRAIASGYKPLILGGDCTITIGAISGLLSHDLNPALVYFDGDIDLNVPKDSPSGVFDGMVLAHLTGHGCEELSHAGGRFPLISEKDIVTFGSNHRSGFIDAGEFKRFEKSAIQKFPLERIQGHAAESASSALEGIGENRAFLLHFDVDVLDESEFPAADVPHKYGMSLSDAHAALRVFLHSPGCAGFVVTEFNAERDPEGTSARKLVDLISSVI